MAEIRDEQQVRSNLGIPRDAQTVLIFTETSHWDPDWLFTSEEYFTFWVKRQLKFAIRELKKEPERVYSVECMFFLRMLFERCPELRESIVYLINNNQLRLMGTGVTSPDTILPSIEFLIRDYQLGDEWLKTNNMYQNVNVAYFPDSFGFSPSVPDLLEGVGVSGAAICRIDGMYFIGNEMESKRSFPRPGTNAFILTKEEKSLDFIWEGVNGSKLLSHWLAFTYGQGEKLAHFGITRELDVPLVVSLRHMTYVARMIQKYVADLRALARTPYLLCPIGYDFSSPIRNLKDLLQEYNLKRFPDSGIWVVNAGLNDYLDLVAFHNDKLPIIKMDPSQYFTGFFTSRPRVKREIRRLNEELLLTDKAVALNKDSISPSASQLLKESWWEAVVTNHHDFITGTATDRVVKKEQIPMTRSAIAKARKVRESIPKLKFQTHSKPRIHNHQIQVSRDEAQTIITTHDLLVRFDKSSEGIVKAISTLSGVRLVENAFELILYNDSGGLWRMGCEYKGGKFEEVDRESYYVTKATQKLENLSEVIFISEGEMQGCKFKKQITIDSDSMQVGFAVSAYVPDRRVLAVRCRLPYNIENFEMDVPGGIVTRPKKWIFNPTFWSVQSFATFAEDGQDLRNLSILLTVPGAVKVENGDSFCDVEAIALRNGKKELAFGFLPLPAQPSIGHDRGPNEFNLALMFHSRIGLIDARVPHVALTESRKHLLGEEDNELSEYLDSLISIDHPHIIIVAVKRASFSNSVILRLFSYENDFVESTLKIEGRVIQEAYIVDGRENDRKRLKVSGSSVKVKIKPGITSLRIVH